MSYKLFDHQKRIVELMTENDRFLLLAEVGTGKSLPTVVHLSNLFLAGDIDSALIVAPLSGIGAWYRDINKLSEQRKRLILTHTTFINYDKLSRKDSRYQKACDREWGCIILDEGHAIAKPTSNRTKYFTGHGKWLGLVAKAKYFYLLTGTLITNGRLEDLWSPLRCVYGEDWMPYADFKHRYLVTKTIPGSYAEMVIGYRNRAELLSIVAQCSYRVLKKDCLDLPEQMPDEVIYVPFADGRNADPFNKTTAELYDDALESYVEGLDMVMDNPLTRLLRMRQIATGHVKESDTRTETGKLVKGKSYPLKSLKAQYAAELILNNRPNKTVVFYQFTETAKALEATLKKHKVSFVTLNGEQKNKLIWQDFQADPSIEVIIVQYQTGSSAIDLFASSYTIYMEPTDSSFIMEQSRARTHRNGQHQPCNYVFLLTEGTVETSMYKRLQSYCDFTEEAYREVAREQLRQKRGE